jgi:VWFA-related protein
MVMRSIALFVTCALAAPSADQKPVFRVGVDLVVVNFTVTDGNGRYVSGLQPEDIRVLEDGISQQIDSFSEGKVVVRSGRTQPSEFAGTNVFILFDTSNAMYEGFAYAEDATADFIRGLDPADSVAVYSFSRNLSRLAPLGRDLERPIAGLRDAVAGAETALYDTLLLTLRDAAKVPGRKVVVVFSNGPDNASVLSPDDVRRVAEEEGIPIYVISTRDKDAITMAVFNRMTERTGGQLFISRKWESHRAAFQSVGEDIRRFYTLTYYPEGSENQDFRKIDVQIVKENGERLHVRARRGYRPRS